MAKWEVKRVDVMMMDDRSQRLRAATRASLTDQFSSVVL